MSVEIVLDEDFRSDILREKMGVEEFDRNMRIIDIDRGHMYNHIAIRCGYSEELVYDKIIECLYYKDFEDESNVITLRNGYDIIREYSENGKKFHTKLEKIVGFVDIILQIDDRGMGIVFEYLDAITKTDHCACFSIYGMYDMKTVIIGDKTIFYAVFDTTSN